MNIVRIIRTRHVTITEYVDVEVTPPENEFRSPESMARDYIALRMALGKTVDWQQIEAVDQRSYSSRNDLDAEILNEKKDAANG